MDLFGNIEEDEPLTKEQDYKSYISSKEWRLKRAQALARSKYLCERCGLSKWSSKLEVHHKSYENFKHEPLDDLEVLCSACHEKADDERREEVADHIADVQYRNACALEDARFEGWCRKVYGSSDGCDYYKYKKYQQWIESKEDW